jgi:AcrR family transcriptional regulator
MSHSETSRAAPGRIRRRRSDGERSRRAILHEAARLATVEGIDGLSISRLAEAVGMSKSGLFAHFGSKQELQLATIDTAREIFAEQVLDQATQTSGALARLRALTGRYLDYVASDTFPGGCFFASALSEVDTHPGPVRDALVEFLGDWLARLEAAVTEAQAEGTIATSEDPGQLAYELEAFLILANGMYVVSRDDATLQRARTAIASRLERALVH